MPTALRDAEVEAASPVVGIHQANYLIDQQLRRLEIDFMQNGGLRERMTRVRLGHRNKRHAQN
ncbi:MAG: hypothetical protein FJ403_17065 [Verrucomicrobia bacterium]|nr:hypothetical protein [Verrucomicrobiota bacterium]